PGAATNHELLVQELLDEAFDPALTPEEVCKDHPDLLPEIRARWQEMCRAEIQLQALFPTPDDSQSTLVKPRPTVLSDLPQIPGYDVESLLGRGGMGLVFRAKHLRLNRTVALKMMLSGAYAGQRERDLFQREAEAVARLRHPNVV